MGEESALDPWVARPNGIGFENTLKVGALHLAVVARAGAADYAVINVANGSLLDVLFGGFDVCPFVVGHVGVFRLKNVVEAK